MLRRGLVVVLFFAGWVVPAIGGEIEPERLQGRASIRWDGQGRVAVSVDADGDGLTDRLILFAPYGPLPSGWSPVEVDAAVEVGPEALRLSSLDGTRNYRFLVADRSEGEPVISSSRGFLAMRGQALAVHDMRGRGESLWSPVSDGIELVVPAADECGGTDLDCSSGGLGSNGCDTQCGGGGVSSPVFGVDLAARRCGVSCAAGYFSCCKCDAGGPSCRCREIRSITNCTSTPDGPIQPH